jgi:transposase
MRVANCIYKVLEDANIKLGSVATTFWESGGPGYPASLIAGEQDGEKLAERARGKLRATVSELSGVFLATASSTLEN